MSSENITPGVLAEMTATVVSAYVSNNSVRATELPDVIASVHSALSGLGQPAPVAEPAAEKVSAAQIKRSMTHDSLISFIDGKPYKTLKRHLSKVGMTPDEYRAKYGLPVSYPMVAPSYSEARSALAKQLGLGQLRKIAAMEAEAERPVEVDAPAKRRGRPAKKTETADA